MANFASMIRSSKQNKMFVLYKQFTAFSRSNRRPRIFNQMYRATFSFNCIVPWGCSEFFAVENFRRRKNNCWGGIVSSPSLSLLLLSFLCHSFSPNQNKSPKQLLLFFVESFYLKIQKHLTFLRKFLLHKKIAQSGGSDRQIIYRLYSQLLTLNTLGTKWFWLLSNSWILAVHNPLIQNRCFFNISTSASLVIGNIWSRRIAFRNQFFSKSQRPIDSKPTPKTFFDHNQYKIRCQTQNCSLQKMTHHIFEKTHSSEGG